MNRQVPRGHGVDNSQNCFYQRFVRLAGSIGPYLSLLMKHIFKKHVTGSEETSREKMIEVNTSVSVMYWTYE